jgi:tetratricopeptide (TPR) repeat protein
LWLAVGIDFMANNRPRWMKPALGVCAVLAATSVAVFTQGLVFESSKIHKEPLFRASRENAMGIVHFAGGDREQAARFFGRAAEKNWYVAHENLSKLAYDDGRFDDALAHLERAEISLMLPEQTFGRDRDRERFIRTTRAEYENLRASIVYELEGPAAAIEAAGRSIDWDAAIAEARYNAAVLQLAAAANSESGSAGHDALIERAIEDLKTAVRLDDTLVAASDLLGVAYAVSGDCERALPFLVAGDKRRAIPRRRYPVETGRGVEFAAALERRRTIEPLPAELMPRRWLQRCEHRVDGPT